MSRSDQGRKARSRAPPGPSQGEQQPPEQSTVQDTSNVSQRSNYESNYPSGALPSSGGADPADSAAGSGEPGGAHARRGTPYSISREPRLRRDAPDDASQGTRAPIGAPNDNPDAPRYGPTRAREQIPAPGTDVASSDHPADDQPVPGSAATHTENKEVMRHFASRAVYERWLKKKPKQAP